jgi:PPOX class probable F420-dependent enzyme
MTYAMTRAQCRAFLAETHVAVVSIADPERGPLTVPVWYAYTPGGVVRIVTATGSEKERLLRGAGRMGLCVQTESAPYKYVSVEGPVTFTAPDYARDVRGIAIRYLGAEMGEAYLAMTADERARTPQILIELRPERWRSADYAKMTG